MVITEKANAQFVMLGRKMKSIVYGHECFDGGWREGVWGMGVEFHNFIITDFF